MEMSDSSFAFDFFAGSRNNYFKYRQMMHGHDLYRLRVYLTSIAIILQTLGSNRRTYCCVSYYANTYRRQASGGNLKSFDVDIWHDIRVIAEKRVHSHFYHFQRTRWRMQMEMVEVQIY